MHTYIIIYKIYNYVVFNYWVYLSYLSSTYWIIFSVHETCILILNTYWCIFLRTTLFLCHAKHGFLASFSWILKLYLWIIYPGTFHLSSTDQKILLQSLEKIIHTFTFPLLNKVNGFIKLKKKTHFTDEPLTYKIFLPIIVGYVKKNSTEQI